MPDFSVVIDYAAILSAAVALLGGLYIARNKAAIENYRLTVESQGVRLKTQEAEMTTMKESGVEMSRRLDELAGQREGYEFAAEVFARAVASAGICAIAWECRGRVLPQSTAPKANWRGNMDVPPRDVPGATSSGG